MKIRLKLLLILFIISQGFLSAQTSLSLENAMKRGLEQNYQLRIESANASILKNNNSLGNAGFFPLLGASAAYSTSVQDINQKSDLTGISQKRSGAKTSTYGAGIELDWTIFDGFRMFAMKDYLGTQDALGRLAYKNAVEETALAISNAYYNIVRQQEQLNVLKQGLALTRKRLELSQARYELGSSSKLEYLQSKVDYNADSASYIRQISEVAKSKVLLKTLINMDVNADFEVDQSIPLATELNLEELVSQTESKNIKLLMAKQNMNAANELLKVTKSDLYPRLEINTRYNFTNVQAQAGFYSLNETKGMNYGVTASWILFNGLNTSRQIQNAKIQQNIVAFNFDAIKQSVVSDLQNAYFDYKSALDEVRLQQENLEVSAQNLDIAKERYQIGKANILEYREAQIGWVTSQNHLLNALYNAKISETKLLQLSGQMPLSK